MLAILKIADGNFEQGFPVMLEMAQDGKATHKQFRGRIPPASDLPQRYDEWRTCHYGLPEVSRIIQFPENQIYEIRQPRECELIANALEAALQTWFASSDFQALKGFILSETPKQELLRLVFQTENDYLQKLPWHFWDLFDSRPNAEFALSARYAEPAGNLSRPVKILAILGNSEGIDISHDRKSLAALPAAKTVFLVEPHRSQLNDALWDQPWDILFFAGHSASNQEGTNGRFWINSNDSLSIQALRAGLRRAIRQGLKLAIFNSCDGLGLAKQLTDLKIPQTIVMREPVPDRVAQAFLKYFLRSFASGTSFYLAVREARERLQGMEGEFPGASWLPVICQNPAEPRLEWPRHSFQLGRFRPQDKAIAWIGLAIIAAVLAIGLSALPLKQWLQPTPQFTALSLGEKPLLAAAPIEGTAAFATALNSQDPEAWDQAIAELKTSLVSNRNNPEAWIYLNNAIAEKNTIGTSRNKLVLAASVASQPEEALRGVAQAQSEFNCGTANQSGPAALNQWLSQSQPIDSICRGRSGKFVEVVIAKYDADNIAKVAQEVVDYKTPKGEEILGVIGRYPSKAIEAAATVLSRNRLVLIASTSNAVRKQNDSSASEQVNLDEQYVFRIVPDVSFTARNLENYIRKNNKTIQSIGILYTKTDPFSQSLYKETAATIQSISTPSSLNCDLSASDMEIKSCVNHFKDRVKALLLIPQLGELEPALKVIEYVYQNQLDLQLLGADTLYDPQLLELGKAASQGRILINVSWARSVDGSTAFEIDAKNLFGNPFINWRTATSYDATQAMLKGLTQQPSRSGLSAELSKIGFQVGGNDPTFRTATGVVEFNQGDRAAENRNDLQYFVKVDRTSSSGTYNFVPYDGK